MCVRNERNAGYNVFHTPFQQFRPAFVALHVSYTNDFLYSIRSHAFFSPSSILSSFGRNRFPYLYTPSSAYAPPTPSSRAVLLSSRPPSVCAAGFARAIGDPLLAEQLWFAAKAWSEKSNLHCGLSINHTRNAGPFLSTKNGLDFGA